MKKALSVVCCSLFMSLFSLSAYSVQNEEYQAYREYFPLDKKVEGVRKIVIFFSFASRESYELIYPYKIGLVSDLKSYGYNIELVPVDFYSPYDKSLAEKWCLEDFLSVPLNERWDVSSEQYFKNVFFWMERLRSTGRDVDIESRIESITRVSGFSRGIARHRDTDMIETVTDRCNQRTKELIESFNVTSVPSVYVNGRYLINEAVMSTRASINAYISLIKYLLEKKSDLVTEKS